MNFLERMVLKKMIKNFLAKYPKQAHIGAVILMAGVSIFSESQTAHALLLQGVSLVPHGATIASAVGSVILWYLRNEK